MNQDFTAQELAEIDAQVDDAANRDYDEDLDAEIARREEDLDADYDY